MTDDAPLKSAVELAMERLRQRDEQAGVEHRPLIGQQKAAIAEIRTFYQAKIAEQEVLHQSRLGRYLRSRRARDARPNGAATANGLPPSAIRRSRR